MNRSNLKAIVFGILLSAGITATSCKDKSKDTTNENTTTTAPVETAPAPAPVEISGDETLREGVRDATKDYPGVTADVNNGEITLTGEIQRTRLPNLMQSLSSLNAKKINNNLKLK